MKSIKIDEIMEDSIRYHLDNKAMLESLSSPFLVKLHYSFYTPSKMYLIQEFVKGGQLFYYLKRNFRFNEN